MRRSRQVPLGGLLEAVTQCRLGILPVPPDELSIGFWPDRLALCVVDVGRGGARQARW